MDKLIKKSEDIDLSGEDIKQILDYKVNLTSYHALDEFNTIDDLLGPHEASIILYETKENFGHWVALFKVDDNTLEFFDSYGMKVDEELNYAKYNNIPYLTNLIKQSNYNIISNTERLQVFKRDINTCGRWTSLRVKMRNYPLKEFIKLFRNNQFYHGDFWVSAMTFIFTLHKLEEKNISK